MCPSPENSHDANSFMHDPSPVTNINEHCTRLSINRQVDLSSILQHVLAWNIKGDKGKAVIVISTLSPEAKRRQELIRFAVYAMASLDCGDDRLSSTVRSTSALTHAISEGNSAYIIITYLVLSTTHLLYHVFILEGYCCSTAADPPLASRPIASVPSSTLPLT